MPPHEKRASTRYDVALPMQLRRGEEAIESETINLSLGGALLRASCDPPLRVSQRVEVTFRLPDLDKALTARAEVRWVDDRSPEVVGIQFVTGFRAKETWALGRFLERHKPT